MLMAVVVSWSTVGHATIIYTDIADAPVFEGSYDLDFNSDGIVDLVFEATAGAQFGLELQGDNRAVENGSTDLAPLAQGFLIQPDLSSTTRQWSSPGVHSGITACMTLPPPFGVTCTGEFHDQVSFMGAEFEIAGETHYGWVRIDSSFIAGGTILDYAYEASPGQGIAAGAIPEPSTWVLLVGGAIAAALGQRTHPREDDHGTASE